MVQIFNRNGNKVFEAKGPGLRWDGTSGGHELPGRRSIIIYSI